MSGTVLYLYSVPSTESCPSCPSCPRNNHASCSPQRYLHAVKYSKYHTPYMTHLHDPTVARSRGTPFGTRATQCLWAALHALGVGTFHLNMILRRPKGVPCPNVAVHGQ